MTLLSYGEFVHQEDEISEGLQQQVEIVHDCDNELYLVQGSNWVARYINLPNSQQIIDDIKNAKDGIVPPIRGILSYEKVEV